VKFSGAGSHTLRLNKNFTPATHRDTSSDLPVGWSVIKSIPKISTGSQHLSPQAGHPTPIKLFHVVFEQHPIAIPTISAIIPSMTQTNNTRQFIQVSAHKDSNNFMHCSNLSLMASDKLSPSMALAELEKMASEYESNGYVINWIYQEFDSVDEEMYGDLFNV
jgi:hypothetical protein